MDLIFHAPYVLRPVLGLLGAGLVLVVVNGLRYRGGDHARAVPPILLVLGLALIVGSGIELTSLTPNARAADTALHTSVVLAVAGSGTILGAAFAWHNQSRKWKRL
jgi:hypothetical protein